jgi:hypothetical protein
MFLQPVMLFGLAALSIPIIIHLLNRRRYEVVDWGAMRFLQMSKVTRRRLFLEELLLMLLRMALLALLVLAFARLVWGGDWLAWMEPRPNRDVVFIFDGSSSMNYTGDGTTPQDAAKEWAAEYIKGLAPGDGVAVLQARQQVLPVVAEPSRDLQHYVPESIRDMPRPNGGCDLPKAVEAAHAILAKSKRGERDVIVFTDGQRFGWSDPTTMQHWDQLASRLGADKPKGAAGPAPRLWVVNVDPKRAPNPPNWSLDPLTVVFPIIPVHSQVTFQTAIEIHGPGGYTPPSEPLELDVDGQFVQNVPAPPAALNTDTIPLTFTPDYRFDAEGTHLVTLTVKPGADHDQLVDDNHRDIVVEVTPPMPILYVDGNPDPAQLKTREQTLLGALALEKDTTPALNVKAVSISEFTPDMLAAGPNGVQPLVLVLCNVAGLTDEQRQAVEKFADEGGGVLATLGDRIDKDAYNLQMYRGGEGWLPAPLTGVEGDETRPDAEAASVDTAEATHPVMTRYAGEQSGDLGTAHFPKWWKIEDGRFFDEKIRPVLAARCYECHSVEKKKADGGVRLDSRRELLSAGDHGRTVAPGRPDQSLLLKTISHNSDLKIPKHGELPDAVIADLTTWIKDGAWWGKDADYGKQVAALRSATASYPFLVERSYNRGRVLLCSVPLDNLWGTKLTTKVAYVPLVHDLVYYLAGARSVEFNLPPGQPIRYRLASDAPPNGFRLQPPVGAEKPLSVGPPTLDAFAAQETPNPHHTLVCDETRESGVYRLTTPEGRTVYYVSQPDPRESDLSASSDDQRSAVAKIVPMQYESDPKKILTARKASDHADEWGPIFLVGMIVLLCGEVWMTRRMVKNRS